MNMWQNFAAQNHILNSIDIKYFIAWSHHTKKSLKFYTSAPHWWSEKLCLCSDLKYVANFEPSSCSYLKTYLKKFKQFRNFSKQLKSIKVKLKNDCASLSCPLNWSHCTALAATRTLSPLLFPCRITQIQDNFSLLHSITVIPSAPFWSNMT